MVTTTRASRPTYSTRAVLKVWRSATEQQAAHGNGWYATAHDVAATLAETYGGSVERAAGILAAFSPRTGWGPNVDLAARAMRTGKASGTMNDPCRKVDRILAGAAPLDVLGGSKVRAFYALILSAGAAEAVCVDRHAHDVAAGRVCDDSTRTALASPKTYAAVAECYVRAARIASREQGRTVTVSEVQATTWTVWRERLRQPGAFDGHGVTVAPRATLASIGA